VRLARRIDRNRVIGEAPMNTTGAVVLPETGDHRQDADATFAFTSAGVA
jgi:hypothetical protein